MKRIVDVVIAGLAAVALAPVAGAVALAVRLRLGSPVLFHQVRTGKDGAPFSLCKFRTMRDAHDAAGRPLPDTARLTDLGRWLRATSLDELPQLWNVLRGDMSLVGPRPLPIAYEARYRPEHRRRHDVRPGITGWAQVNGRNTTSWDERFALDVHYVDHRGPLLDLRILARTPGTVLGRRGVTAPGEATMSEFRGDDGSDPGPDTGPFPGSDH